MSRPATQPTWANAGTKTDPGGGKRALGWIGGEVVPSAFLNFWQGLVGDWINQLASELDALIDIYTGDKTYAGHNTFSGEVDFGGVVDMHAGLDVETGNVRVLGSGANITVDTGDVTATAGDVKAGGAFISAGGSGTYTYAPGVPRELAFPLTPLPPGLALNSGSGELVISDAALGFREWTIGIRPGMAGFAIDVRMRVDSAANTWRIVKYSTDWGSTVGLTVVTEDSGVSAGTGIQDFHLDTASIDPTIEYRLRWEPGHVDDQVIAVRATFTETAIGTAM